MKIERKFEMVTETKRRFVIRQTPSVKQTFCAECGSPVLTIAQTAVLFGIKQRRIFQIVETGTTHFMEIETGVLMICLQSLDRFLKSGM